MRLNYNGQWFNYTSNKYQPTWVDANLKISVQNKEDNPLNLPDEELSLEYWGKLINSTHLPSSNVDKSNYQLSHVKNDLQFINARLDYLRKTITYWDAYQIQGVINNPNEKYLIERLEKSRSLIINTGESFKWNNQDCRRGGMFVNTIDQGIVYIPPQPAGAYKPVIVGIIKDENNKEIESNSTTSGKIKISYAFEDMSTIGGSNTATIVHSMTDNDYYPRKKSDGKKVYDLNNQLTDLMPVINFYLHNEEVLIDFNLLEEVKQEEVKQEETEQEVVEEVEEEKKYKVVFINNSLKNYSEIETKNKQEDEIKVLTQGYSSFINNLTYKVK